VTLLKRNIDLAAWDELAIFPGQSPPSWLREPEQIANEGYVVDVASEVAHQLREAVAAVRRHSLELDDVEQEDI
jgi:hypothetical protein